MFYRKIVSLAIVLLFSINSVSYSAPIQTQQDTLRATAASLTTAPDIQKALERPKAITEQPKFSAGTTIYRQMGLPDIYLLKDRSEIGQVFGRMMAEDAIRFIKENG